MSDSNNLKSNVDILVSVRLILMSTIKMTQSLYTLYGSHGFDNNMMNYILILLKLISLKYNE